MNKKLIKNSGNFSSYEKINPDFAKVLIKIAYAGDNVNRTSISKDVFEKSMYQLAYLPVVGHYLKDRDMFGGHDSEIVIDEDGDWNEHCLTVPYGVVSNEKPFWKTVKATNGDMVDYLCCYAYLWVGRYPELSGIEDHDFSQSMEILVNSGYYREDDNVYVITDFTFSALCILERDKPCFQDSDISIDFSKKDTFEELYNKLIKKAHDEYSLCLEGGNTLDNKYFDNKEEEKEEKTEECQENEESKEEDMKKKCKSSDESKEETKEEDKEEKEEEKEEDMKKKCKSSDESKEESINYNEIISLLKEEINTLKASNEKLKNDFESLTEENAELKEFKSNIETKEREEAEAKLFAEYDVDLKDIESYKELKENKDKYSIEELTNKCIFEYGKMIKSKSKAKKSNFSKNQNNNKIVNDSIDNNSNESNDSADDYFATLYKKFN